MTSETDRSSLTRFAWLSICAALVTICLKVVVYRLTGSVGLLSDAIESLVNLVGGIMALAMLTIAARPADEDHPYGHSKAEYFSSGVEGSLILLAAVSIGYAAVARLLAPKPLEQVGLGLAVSVLASLVNLVVALLLLRVSCSVPPSSPLVAAARLALARSLRLAALALTPPSRLSPLLHLQAEELFAPILNPLILGVGESGIGGCEWGSPIRPGTQVARHLQLVV
jgi:Co/Zn/Cd efflux system component